MWIFGGPCKQLVKYSGISLDLSGLGLSGLGPLKFDLGKMTVKRELIQAASEIAQLLDALQFSNCVKIEQTPKDSPKRMKLINQAMESERQLIQLAFLTRLIMARPNSEPLQRALSEWVATHAPRVQQLSTQVQGTAATRGMQLLNLATVNSSIDKAKKAEPLLVELIQNKISFDMEKVLTSVEK